MTVLEGRAGTPMAPYATILTSEAARAIREYGRELACN